MWLFINTLIPGVVASLVATLIVVLFQQIYNAFLKSRSPYSGEWESSIYDDIGNVEKTDILNITEKHGKITGTMKRVMPIKQNDREWIVIGFAKNRHIILSIISKKETQASDGSVYAVLSDDGTYKGYYLKNIESQGIKSVEICLKLKREKHK